jgi:hypothetical protein
VFFDLQPMDNSMKNIFILFLVLLLCACSAPLTLEQQAKKARMDAIGKIIDENYVEVSYVSISCVGHADAVVTGYSIREIGRNEWYGGGTCGGTNAAGYPIPKEWRPGMKVKVRWKLDKQPWRETTTNIMPYRKAGMLFMHVFNNDQVRIVSSAEFSSESPLHQIARDAKIPPPEGE